MPRKQKDTPLAAPVALPPAFGAVLGAKPGADAKVLHGKAVISRPDQLDKARKPKAGANRTMGPRKGHR